MKSRNDIRASVIWEWDADKKHTKFRPGDKAQVKSFHYTEPKTLQNKLGHTGTVIAVSHNGNGNIRGHHRWFSRYYVEFPNKEVFGFHSQYLDKV